MSWLLVVAFPISILFIISTDIKIKTVVWTRNVTRLKYIFITASVEGNNLDFKKKLEQIVIKKNWSRLSLALCSQGVTVLCWSEPVTHFIK